MAVKRPLVDALRVDAAGGSLPGDRACCVHQLGAAAVVEGERQCERPVLPGERLGFLDPATNTRRHPPTAAADEADTHPALVELVAPRQ